MRFRFILILILTPFTLFAQDQITLNWVGCGISKVSYINDLVSAFETQSNIKINVEGGGATKGIRDVASGVADLGGTCRYSLPDDPREAEAGLEPMAWDALVVITHPDNPVNSLTREQVKAIYAGEISHWTQVGGPNEKIELLTRKSKISGVGRLLRKLIFADFDYKIASTESFPSSGPLERAIENRPDALGITGVSSARLRNVKILNIDGIEPSYENIKSGQYTMYRPLYLSYNPDSPKLKYVKQFIKFAHSKKGRDIMKKNGTLPYIDGITLVMKVIEQDASAYKRGAKMGLSY